MTKKSKGADDVMSLLPALTARGRSDDFTQGLNALGIFLACAHRDPQPLRQSVIGHRPRNHALGKQGLKHLRAGIGGIPHFDEQKITP
jgi:hypothetical protein